MNAKRTPIATPFPQRMVDFRQRHLPIIVWSVAVVCCVWMLAGRTQRFEHIGLARSLQYEVSAESTGRLDTLVVALYDDVQRGDVVAKLDDAELTARVERANASIRQLRAELDAARVRLLSAAYQDRTDWATDLRRFQADEEDRRLAALELKAAIEGDQIEQERLALELRRAGPLLETGLIGQARYDEIRLLHDEVKRRNEENQILLAQTDEELGAARRRREEFERGLPTRPDEEPLLRPLREAIAVETERLREIEARRASTVLRSPVGGQVSSILCRAGQTVVPGEPILTVSERVVTEILAYLGESEGLGVRENAPVLVSSLRRPEKVAESFVVRVAPRLELMPERLWRDPSTPQYGRAVVIAATPKLGLLPGELLSVRFGQDP